MQTQGASPDELVTQVTWGDINSRLTLEDDAGKVFFEPNGIHLDLDNAKQTLFPERATHVVLFVSRTGETLQRLQEEYNLPVVVLFDCAKTDRNKGWLVMPWETAPRVSIPALSEEEEEALGRVGLLNEALMVLDLDQSRALGLTQQLTDMILAQPARRRLGL